MNIIWLDLCESYVSGVRISPGAPALASELYAVMLNDLGKASKHCKLAESLGVEDYFFNTTSLENELESIVQMAPSA